METPFLDFYNRCIENGKLPEDGICSSFENDTHLFELLYMFSGYTSEWGTNWYWGYNGDVYKWVGADPKKQDKIMYTFTPMRQNIILLCAAINGEL